MTDLLEPLRVHYPFFFLVEQQYLLLHSTGVRIQRGRMKNLGNFIITSKCRLSLLHVQEIDKTPVQPSPCPSFVLIMSIIISEKPLVSDDIVGRAVLSSY